MMGTTRAVVSLPLAGRDQGWGAASPSDDFAPHPSFARDLADAKSKLRYPPRKGQGYRICESKGEQNRIVQETNRPKNSAIPRLFMHMRLPCRKGEGEGKR